MIKLYYSVERGTLTSPSRVLYSAMKIDINPRAHISATPKLLPLLLLVKRYYFFDVNIACATVKEALYLCGLYEYLVAVMGRARVCVYA